MHFTLFHHVRTALLLLITCSFLACQQTDDSKEVETANTSAAATAPTRPAPDFYVLPPDMANNRVWICVDDASDIFHEKHDCPVLVQCKGTFRNVTLVRAIEGFGRYNCQECSHHLDHIFDEDMVR